VLCSRTPTPLFRAPKHIQASLQRGGPELVLLDESFEGGFGVSEIAHSDHVVYMERTCERVALSPSSTASPVREQGSVAAVSVKPQEIGSD